MRDVTEHVGTIALDGHLVMTGQLPVTIYDDQGSLYVQYKDLLTTNLP